MLAEANAIEVTIKIAVPRRGEAASERPT